MLKQSILIDICLKFTVLFCGNVQKKVEEGLFYKNMIIGDSEHNCSKTSSQVKKSSFTTIKGYMSVSSEVMFKMHIAL
jgi:hypothetical protein